jgi:hypothetical protein
MATSTEEMVLRLGMDASALRKGMADATNAAKQGGDQINAGLGESKKGFRELKGAFQDLAQGDWGGAIEKTLKMLANRAGILGKVMSFVFSGPGILAAGAVAAFLSIKKALDDFNKDLDEQAARAAKGYGDMAQSSKSSAIEGSKSARELARHIRDLGDAQQTLKDKTDAAVKALRDQAVAELELSDAKSAAKIAEVNARESRGEISQAQAIIQRENIRKQSEQEKIAIKKAAEESELAKLKEAKDAAEKSKPILEQNAKNAQYAVTGLDENGKVVNQEARNRNKKLANIPKENADLQKQADESKARAAVYQKQIDDILNSKYYSPTNPAQQKALKEAQEKLEEENRLTNMSLLAIKANEKILNQLTIEQENAVEAYRVAKEKMDENSKSYDALNLQINELTQKIATENATGEKIKPFKTAQQIADEAHELAGTTAGKEVLSLGQLASDISTGKDTSKADADRLIKAESQIAGHKVDLKTAIEMAKTAAHNDAAFIAHVGKLADTQQTIIDGLFQNGIVIRDTP